MCLHFALRHGVQTTSFQAQACMSWLRKGYTNILQLKSSSEHYVLVLLNMLKFDHFISLQVER